MPAFGWVPSPRLVQQALSAERDVEFILIGSGVGGRPFDALTQNMAFDLAAIASSGPLHHRDDRPIGPMLDAE